GGPDVQDVEEVAKAIGRIAARPDRAQRDATQLRAYLREKGLDWPGAARTIASSCGVRLRQRGASSNGPGPRSPAPAGAARIVAIATAVWNEASIVAASSETASGESVRLSELYVRRDVEGKLLSEVGASGGRLLLLQGDAGTGKTSLLWHLRR